MTVDALTPPVTVAARATLIAGKASGEAVEPSAKGDRPSKAEGLKPTAKDAGK